MAFVTTKEMFKKAYEGGYAVGAFNVNNMEIIQGITEAAIENRAPLVSAGFQGCPCLCQARVSDEIDRGGHPRRRAVCRV